MRLSIRRGKTLWFDVVLAHFLDIAVSKAAQNWVSVAETSKVSRDNYIGIVR